jgi:methanogenic corrinoid protein MtbC1
VTDKHTETARQIFKNLIENCRNSGIDPYEIMKEELEKMGYTVRKYDENL